MLDDLDLVASRFRMGRISQRLVDSFTSFVSISPHFGLRRNDMSGLYDSEASMRRVHRAEQAVKAQRTFLARQVDPQARASAEANLGELEDTLEIARKTHSLIMDVILQKAEYGDA